jgi:hypothetical protein
MDKQWQCQLRSGKLPNSYCVVQNDPICLGKMNNKLQFAESIAAIAVVDEK